MIVYIFRSHFGFTIFFFIKNKSWMFSFAVIFTTFTKIFNHKKDIK